MARKYKFHKTYAVIYFSREMERYYYKTFLTKREAMEFVRSLHISHDIVSDVEVVKRVWAYNTLDGRIPLEKL